MFERSGCYPNFPAVISKIRHFEDKDSRARHRTLAVLAFRRSSYNSSGTELMLLVRDVE